MKGNTSDFFNAEDAELLSQEEIERVLHDLLKGLQELGSDGAVDYTMIAGHCDAHRLTNDNLVITDDWFGGHSADCQNRSFRWIDHGGELINAEHSQIADRESSTRI